jgi:hypothetical protein
MPTTYRDDLPSGLSRMFCGRLMMMVRIGRRAMPIKELHTKMLDIGSGRG